MSVFFDNLLMWSTNGICFVEDKGKYHDSKSE